MPSPTRLSSRRKPGPITTGLGRCAERNDQYPSKLPPRRMGPCFRRDDSEFAAADVILHYPATSLMRAISSSTAFSTGTFSLTTRFIALAQTFSLFRIVNFQFLVKSNGAVPPLNWLWTALRCLSDCQNGLS